MLPIRREGLRRGVAVLLVYLIFGGAFGYAMWILVPILANQVTSFIEAVPDNVAAISQSLSHLFEEYRTRVPVETQTQVDSYLQGAGDIVCRSVKQVGSVRLSLHVYNVEDEIERVAEMVAKVAKDGNVPEAYRIAGGPVEA